MKIAFLLDTFPSPTETFIARDIQALRRHGLEIEVFALKNGAGARPLMPPASVPLALRGAWEKLISPGLRADYFKQVGAMWWQELNRSGAAQEIQHVHAGWASHPAYIAWGAAQKSGLTWSFSGHAHDVFVSGGDLRGKLASARFASVCTGAAKRHLQSLAPEQSEKIIYAPHGIESQNIEFSDWNFPPIPQLLAVGRLVEKKGFGVLLDACAVLRSRGFAFTCRIIGEGPLREQLKQRTQRLHLGDCVQFSGALTSDEVLAAMRESSCLVVPAITASDGDRDGLPNVILEAAACGLPIVASRAGAIEEFIDESTGLLCAPHRAEALAEAIQAVFSQRDETQQRRLTARVRVEKNFDLMTNAGVLARQLRTV
jgi:glycosyltransferase involved in cell wall biosynthesis